MAPMHPLIRQTIERCLGYGWQPGLIQKLLRYRLNIRLPRRCIETVRSEKPCSPGCAERCPLR